MRTADRRASPLVIMALAGIVILSLAATATAESGTFRLIRSVQYNYTTFEFADQTVRASESEGVGTILESSGGPFVAGREQPRDLHDLLEAE